MMMCCRGVCPHGAAAPHHLHHPEQAAADPGPRPRVRGLQAVGAHLPEPRQVGPRDT